eukprot:PhF_6_TR9427/c0_g1_i1/m.14737/K12035/TRIM71; tripartite motif-containing protein 71
MDSHMETTEQRLVKRLQKAITASVEQQPVEEQESRPLQAPPTWHVLRYLGEKRGSEPKQFLAPTSCCSMKTGTLVITDCLNHRLQFIHRDGFFEKILGPFDFFNCPHGVAINENSTIIAVCDEDNHRIVLVSPSGVGHVVDMIDNGRGKGKDQLDHPTGLCFLRGEPNTLIAVCDSRNDRIQIIDITMKDEFLRSIGNGRGEGSNQFDGPWCIQQMKHNTNLLVSDSRNHRIHHLTLDGVFLRTYGSLGPEIGQFNTPEGLCQWKGNTVAVCDSNNNRIVILDLDDGRVLHCLGGALSTAATLKNCFCSPVGVCNLFDDTLVICDMGNDRIVQLQFW